MMGPSGVMIGGGVIIGVGKAGAAPVARGGSGGFDGPLGMTNGALILFAKDFLGFGIGRLCTASMSITSIP